MHACSNNVWPFHLLIFWLLATGSSFRCPEGVQGTVADYAQHASAKPCTRVVSYYQAAKCRLPGGLGQPRSGQRAPSARCCSISNAAEAAQCTTSTHWELLALQRFVDSPVFGGLSCRYLIKLTAKYKLPELVPVLNQQLGRLSPHLFVQHLQLGGHQNCEIVGFARARLPAQLQALRAFPHRLILEQRLRQLLQQPGTVARRLPRLRNTAPYRRGSGSYLTHL